MVHVPYWEYTSVEALPQSDDSFDKGSAALTSHIHTSPVKGIGFDLSL